MRDKAVLMRLGGTVRRRSTVLIASAVLVALSIGGGAAQARGIPSFLQPLSAVGRGDAAARHEVRSRFVRPSLGVLFGADGRPRDPRSLPAIRFELFPDVDLTGIVERVESPGLGRVWVGSIDGLRESSFVLGVVGDAVTLHIDSPSGVYEVSSDAAGRYRAVQIDQSRLVDHPAGMSALRGDARATTLAKSSGGSGGSTGGTGPTIDVMVVYTPNARSRAGGVAKMESLIASAASQTNKVYANSGVNATVRIVATSEVAYTESGDITKDLSWLTRSSVVATRRDAAGADAVTMVIEERNYCGLADALRATAAEAFDVVSRACATANLSFAHELGHLEGARHDVYVDNATSPYPSGHGFVNVAKGWRTVMAYNNACQAVGKSCTRIAYFSNASQTYSGAPLGDATYAENYLAVNDNVATMAGFRTAP